MTDSISAFGIDFIIQGMIDFVRNFIGFGSYENSMIFMEIVIGVLMTLLASIVHISFNRHFLYHGESGDNEE